MAHLSWLLLILVIFPCQTSSHLNHHPIYRHLAKKAMPQPSNGQPLNLHIGFYVESLGNFRSTEMTFDMDLYLYMSWQDDRMRHNETDYVLINDKAVLDRMWLPDLYFANARSSYFHEVTIHNFNMFVSQEGTVSYGTRVTLNLACHLALQNYPLDRQTCLIKIISFFGLIPILSNLRRNGIKRRYRVSRGSSASTAHNEDAITDAHVKSEMNCTWFNDGAIRYNPEIGLPEYHIISMENGYCNGVFHYTITPNSSRIGDFSCLLGMLHLKRAIGYHLVQSYIPTSLIVAISWVSFWIDRRAVPARVSLSFTTLLTLSTQGNGIRYALPPVSYAKAIDYFYGVCMFFIFGVLLEFALVNSYMRRANKYNQMAEKLQNGIKTASYGVSDFDSEYEGRPYICIKNTSAGHLMFKAITFSRKALFIDQASRLVFPLTFAVFNIFYWIYYLNDPEEVYYEAST